MYGKTDKVIDMRKKGILVVIAIAMVIAFVSSNGIKACAQEDFKPLNPVIGVGEKIYVQHDENNGNVYDLQKSETGTTTVYETILPEFTAGKVWTREGEFVDNVSTPPRGATSPENYIPVKSGEEYFIKAYGDGIIADGLWCAPVLFLDDDDNVISDALVGQFSKSKAGVIVAVPEKATKMHITMYNHQSFTLQKVLHLTDKEFDQLPIHRTELEEDVKQKYEEYEKDRTLYKKTGKAYITFVNDDTWGSIDEFAELFMSKDIPLVLATIPESLIENASSQKETRLDVARRVEKAGGEIIAHNGGVLTREDFSDYNRMYTYFVRPKQLFNYYGFDVNGIILAGGTGQVSGAKETEEWASSFYSYSDLYGVEYDKKGIALDSVYFHGRKGLGGYSNDLEKIKKEIDTAIANGSWLVFYFHTYSEISGEVLGQVLDYVNSKDETELEVVTYKEMYQKNAAKESEMLNNKNTYYVSSTGISNVGTDENNPMSYETAKKKGYLSGDTILFKRGDTFYGNFNPTIGKVNDEITTISSYGEGEMPQISGYKIADAKESWQLHEEGIYKINLTDKQSFSGLMTTDNNSTDIGFLEDTDGTKYHSKKGALSELEKEYDFYCDETYLYIKSEENPYSKLGELKLATQTNLFTLHSNLKIENIRFSGTGAHALAGSSTSIENVEISNNIIEDVGGSYLKETIRYGNGIEFYNSDVSNISVKDNIIRNVYDVGFTIQGTQGSGKNVVVKNNVFVKISQDSEIWESGSSTGIKRYEFTDNISVDVGRGWGYDARPDQYVASHIIFWQYLIEDTDIYFHHNTVYNPRRLYFMEQTHGTNVFFKENDYIRSDHNTYFLAKDAKIFRDSYSISQKDDFISEYKKDANSTFSLIEVDEDVVTVSTTSDSIGEIKAMFKSGGQPTVPQSPTVTTQPTIILSPTVTMKLTKIPSATATMKPTATSTPAVTIGPTVTASATATMKPTTTASATATMKPTATSTPTVTIGPTVTSNVTATIKPTAIPSVTVTMKPTTTPRATVAVKPTETPRPTAEMNSTETLVIPKGTELTDTKTKAVYTVTKSGRTNGTVTYTKPTSKSLTSLSVPKTVKIDEVTYKVTAIAPNALKNCKKLKKVTIGSNITTIGTSAFSGCSKLKTVAMGTNVKTIGANAFYKCGVLTKVTIPAKVTKIGKQAFYGCKKLKKITIKTSKLKSKNIGSKAFKGIDSEAVIKVPENKLKSYEKILKNKGFGSKVKIIKVEDK